METIISWIKENNLYFSVGYLLTHKEFTATIWQYYEKFDFEKNLYKKYKKTRGWSALHVNMEEALKLAYEKAKIELHLPPKPIYLGDTND